jgi:hypothetical protein
VRVNVFSGITSTLFMVAAIALFDSGANSTVRRRPHDRDLDDADLLPVDLPGGDQAALLAQGTSRARTSSRAATGACSSAAGLVMFWIVLGSFTSVFPGVLEDLFGIDYGFVDTWGVTRAKFEALTFGTLGFVTLIAIGGYMLGAPTRARRAEVPIGAAEIPPAPAAAG